MIAADTNILVRAIIGDDAAQAEAARRWMSAHQVGGIFVDHVVLVELVWVLRARYQQSRDAIARVLELLLGTGGIVVPEEQVVRGALRAYKGGRGDFADHLIRERASAHGFAPLTTFDESLHGQKGFARVK